jgi:hypothetical protein
MPSGLPSLEDRVRALFSIDQIKIFHQCGDYVACYGDPAMADDGWVINLPASEFFEGAYHSLPFEVQLNASWAQARSIVRQPLSRCISLSPSEASWSSKASSIGMPNYFHADLFRDVAILLNDHNQPSLAFRFIKVARDLRPSGPLICKLYEDILATCG